MFYETKIGILLQKKSGKIKSWFNKILDFLQFLASENLLKLCSLPSSK